MALNTDDLDFIEAHYLELIQRSPLRALLIQILNQMRGYELRLQKLEGKVGSNGS